MRKANPAGEVTEAKAVRAESYCGARDGQAVGEVTGGLLLVCEAGNGEEKHVKLVCRVRQWDAGSAGDRPGQLGVGQGLLDTRRGRAEGDWSHAGAVVN